MYTISRNTSRLLKGYDLVEYANVVSEHVRNAELIKSIKGTRHKIHTHILTDDIPMEIYEKLKDSGGAYVSTYPSSPTSYIFDIAVYYDTYEILSDRRKILNRLIKRVEPFLSSIDVPMTRESMLLFVILHEYGHVSFNLQFILLDMTIELEALYKSSESISLMFLNNRLLERWLTAYDMDLPQLVNSLESRGDIFAMENFLPLWKKIQSDVRINPLVTNQ